VSTDPGLIASFYGGRGSLDGLRAALVESFTYVELFPVPGAPDTEVVQVAINGNGPDAFSPMRHDLSDAVGNHAHDGWGHTLVYQADLEPGESSEAALTALLPHCRGLSQEVAIRTASLAAATIAAGHLWLLEIPTDGASLDSSTVYLALADPGDGQVLLNNWLLGPSARLLLPDLTAHKGYHAKRESYADAHVERFRQELDELREDCDTTLLASPPISAADLENIGRRLPDIHRVAGLYEGLHVNVRRFLANYRLQIGRVELGAIGAYHLEQLEALELDIALLIVEAERALETARSAVDLHRARFEEIRARTESRVAQFLGLLGLAIAVPQLVDRPAAIAIAGLLGVSLTEDEVLAALGWQIGVSVLAVLLVRLLIWIVSRIRAR
jgi:hypothetical protein